MSTHSNLVRKQYLISEDNVRKVEKLAKSSGTSAADIVRQAIDSYDPERVGDMEAPELMKLVSQRLKESILATQHTNKKVAKALKLLDRVNG